MNISTTKSLQRLPKRLLPVRQPSSGHRDHNCRWAKNSSSSSSSSSPISHPPLSPSSQTGLFQSQIVSNTGSIARDVLAAERTFLAWSRTGLGFVGAGSAMFAAYHRFQQFKLETAVQRDEHTFNKGEATKSLLADDGDGRQYVYAASALLIANGAFLLAFSTRRYLRIVTLLQNEKFLVDTRGTLLAITTTAVSTFTSLVLIFQE